jgi:hypothetical protein
MQNESTGEMQNESTASLIRWPSFIQEQLIQIFFCTG